MNNKIPKEIFLAIGFPDKRICEEIKYDDKRYYKELLFRLGPFFTRIDNADFNFTVKVKVELELKEYYYVTTRQTIFIYDDDKKILRYQESAVPTIRNIDKDLESTIDTLTKAIWDGERWADCDGISLCELYLDMDIVVEAKGFWSNSESAEKDCDS